MSVIRRIETKYELDALSAGYLSQIVGQHLPCFEYVKGFPQAYVTTVYFDTDRLDLYKRAVRSSENNLKVRLREYSYRPPREAELLLPYCFLELKRRTEGIVVKQRLRLAKSLAGRFLAGEDIRADLAAEDMDTDVENREKLYEEMRSFLALYRMQPRSVVEYRRKVYQREEDDLRITFDDHLTVYPPTTSIYEESETLRPRGEWVRGRRLDKVIMEIKSPGRQPDWLENVLRSFVPCKISKFTESMGALVS